MCEWKDKIFQQALTELCFNLVKIKYVNSPILFFTEHKRNDVLFRANPCFDKNDSNEPWYDWALIDWGIDKALPAKLMIFMQVDLLDAKEFYVNKSFISESGQYAICHSFDIGMQQPAHLDSRLMFHGKILENGNTKNPDIFAVIVQSIADPCIAIPYVLSANAISAKEWLICKSRKDWNKIFLNFMKENIIST